MVYLSNAFSLNMFDWDNVCCLGLRVKKLDIDAVKQFLKDGFKSVVGHQDLANILTNMLGIDIPYNRATVQLELGDVLIVAQYVGNRLPEGSTTLPPDAKIIFLAVTIG